LHGYAKISQALFGFLGASQRYESAALYPGGDGSMAALAKRKG
jgi:hypothetical protein